MRVVSGMKEKRWKLSTTDTTVVKGLTPATVAIFYYLENRRLRTRREGATKREMLENLQFAESTLDRSLKAMRKAGLLVEVAYRRA